ncbi:MAG TPA: hypothetical protein VFU49_00955, partial [Ktedonobacteraceae bacterium]|nr:hypothetical protein [Ktedonobacteraceae bacterium]
NVFIGHIMRMAKAAGVRLRAEFIPNERNRMMLITYKLGGFREVEKQEEMLVFEHDLTAIAPVPPYVTLNDGSADC